MQITVGTFNLNNLFGRWNLYVEVPEARSPQRMGDETGAADSSSLALPRLLAPQFPPREWLEPAPDTLVVHDDRRQLDQEFGAPARALSLPDVQVTIDGTILSSGEIRWRTNPYSGRAIFRKTDRARATLAARITQMNVDVLAVQEVEDIVALEEFARSEAMRPMGYRHVVLVEGNDKRLIDVGVLSRLPFGKVTSWRHRTYGNAEGGPVFSRDLLEVDVLSANRKRVLFTLFVTHLKSQLARNEAERSAADRRRTQQAETVRQIIGAGRRRRYLVVGDMNDTPESAPLAAFAQWELLNALTSPSEVGGPYPESDPYQPPNTAWTHRYKAAGPPRYDLFDQIWLSPALATRLNGAWILRRTSRTGDASDHDPAWVSLDL